MAASLLAFLLTFIQFVLICACFNREKKHNPVYFTESKTGTLILALKDNVHLKDILLSLFLGSFFSVIFLPVSESEKEVYFYIAIVSLSVVLLAVYFYRTVSLKSWVKVTKDGNPVVLAGNPEKEPGYRKAVWKAKSLVVNGEVSEVHVAWIHTEKEPVLIVIYEK